MEIIAKVKLDERNRQLVYSASFVADNTPLCDSNINIMEQIDLLDKAHKAIKAVVKELNGRLFEGASLEPATYIRASPTSALD